MLCEGKVTENVGKPVLVGIAGISGSGKTDIARIIQKGLGNVKYSSVLLPMVDYYKNNVTNYNSFLSFDIEKLNDDVSNLVNGRSINKPKWDFASHSRMEETIIVNPADFIIVEGIYALMPGMPGYDISIFVKTDLDVCLERRLERDKKERYMTPEETFEEWLKVKENLKNILPQKYDATFVIYWNRDRRFGIKSLTGICSALLYKKSLYENKNPKLVDDMRLDDILSEKL